MSSEDQSDIMYNSFDGFLENLSNLRPSIVTDLDGTERRVFNFNNGTPVFFVAGEMEGIDWMDIYLCLPSQVRASRLDLNRRLLQANCLFSNQPIPAWFAANEQGQTFYISRLDWRCLRAETVVSFIDNLCQRINAVDLSSLNSAVVTAAAANDPSKNSTGDNIDYEIGTILPPNPDYENYMKQISDKHPSEEMGDKTIFYFDGRPVYFLRGEVDGEIHWFDIIMEMEVCRTNKLEATQLLLESNQEMGLSTPIPTWFAASSNNDKALFVNRLDWRHVTLEVLEDHIRRCYEQMGEALIQESAQKHAKNSRHHAPTFKDRHRTL